MVFQNLDQQFAYGAFYSVVVATFITWVLMILMRPRDRAEWAAFSMLTGFNLFLWRLLWIALTGNRALPQPHGLIFWIVVLLCVGFYCVVFILDWGGWFLERRRRSRDRSRRLH